MTTVEELAKILEERTPAMESDKEFIKLRDFYHEMQELGVAKQPQYDLPPLDTIGRRIYEIQHLADKEISVFG